MRAEALHQSPEDIADEDVVSHTEADLSDQQTQAHWHTAPATEGVMTDVHDGQAASHLTTDDLGVIEGLVVIVGSLRGTDTV